PARGRPVPGRPQCRRLGRRDRPAGPPETAPGRPVRPAARPAAAARGDRDRVRPMRRAALVVAGLLLFLDLPFAGRAAAATQQVMMQDYAFSPAALTVRAGDTVTWMQHDEAPHDVVTTSAPVAFRSPRLSAGQS